MTEARASLPPLVDREEEVARIAEALDAAERGEGQLLLLRGEAGCGKTRLLQEAAAEASHRDFVAGFGTALAESVVPYHPWQEALRGLGLARILEEAPPPRILGAYVVTSKGKIVTRAERKDVSPSISEAVSTLRAFARKAGEHHAAIGEDGNLSFLSSGDHRIVVLRGDGHSVGAVVEGKDDEAFLADLHQTLEKAASVGKAPKEGNDGEGAKVIEESLRTLVESGKYDGTDYSKDDPKLRQARLFDQVALGLARKAGLHPQLVAVDDLQWADPSSLALLRYVARNVKDRRVLLVGAYRVEEAGVRPHLRDALTRMEQEQLPAGLLVPGLPRPEMRRLAEVFLGPHALPNDFLELLWHETQGYPLFIREVLRGLEGEGAVQVRGAAKRLVRPTAELSIPRRVREAIRLRLDRLPHNERQLLDAAAACGTRFTTALLAKVAGEGESKVLPGLENLVRVHGLLRTVENGFAFDHPAVQEVAYEALPAEARRAHHLEAAEWLELVGGPVEDVADHFYHGGDPRAVPKLREAAEAARARYANAEAIRFLDEAMSLEENPGNRREILDALGSVYRLVGDFEASLAAHRTALDLAETKRDRARTSVEIASTQLKMGEFERARSGCVEVLAIVEGEAVVEEALILATLGNLHFRRGDYDRALENYGKSLDIQEKIGDQHGVAESLNGIGNVDAMRGDYDQALENYGRSLDIREKIGDQQGVAGSLGNIGSVHYLRGDYGQALENYGRSLDVQEKIGDQHRVATSLYNIGNVHYHRGDYDQALENYGRSLDIREKIGDQQGVAWSLNGIGIVHQGRGDYDRARECHRRSLDVHEKIGDQHGVAESLGNIGNLHFRRGDYDQSLECHRRSLDIQEKIGDQHGVAESLNGIGNVDAMRGDYGQALENYGRSLDIREKIGDQQGKADTIARIAEVSLRNEDIANAENYCNLALSLATQVGAKGTISEARRLRGMLDRKRKRWVESAADFNESLRISAQIGEPFEEGRTYYEFGLMWKEKGDSERAMERLLEAAQVFERIGARGELERTEQELRRFH